MSGGECVLHGDGLGTDGDANEYNGMQAYISTGTPLFF